MASEKARLVEGVGMEGDVLFAGGLLFVVGLYPVFPMLACGAVFAAELEARNFGVADFALVVGFGREVLNKGIGESGAGDAIEDVGFDFFAGLEGERNVAAIVESLLEGTLEIVFGLASSGTQPSNSSCTAPGARLRGSRPVSRVYLRTSAVIVAPSESAS